MIYFIYIYSSGDSMAYQFKTAEKAVGSFVIFGIAAVILSTAFYLKNKIGSVKKNYYSSFYKTADAMSDDMEVFYKGIKIGKVSSIKLLKNDKIKLTYYVFRNYANRIKKDSVAVFQEAVIGSGIISITPGYNSSPTLPNKSVVFSQDDPQGAKIINDRFGYYLPPKRLDKMTYYLKKFSTLISDDNGPLMGLLNEVKGLIAMLKNPGSSTGKILETLSDTTKKFDKIMGKISDEGSTDKIDETLLNVQGMTREIELLIRQIRSNPLLGGKNKKYVPPGKTIDKNEKYSDK